jgi:hypothetical protein
MTTFALDFQYPVVATALTLVIKSHVGTEPVTVEEAEIVICDTLGKVGKLLEHPERQVVLLIPHANWLRTEIPTHDRLRVFYIVEEPGQPSTLDLLAWLKSLRDPPVV